MLRNRRWRWWVAGALGCLLVATGTWVWTVRPWWIVGRTVTGAEASELVEGCVWLPTAKRLTVTVRRWPDDGFDDPFVGPVTGFYGDSSVPQWRAWHDRHGECVGTSIWLPTGELHVQSRHSDSEGDELNWGPDWWFGDSDHPRGTRDLAYADVSHVYGIWGVFEESGDELRRFPFEDLDLRGGSLEGATLWRASLRGTNVSGVSFEGADLRDADLREAIGLELEQVLSAHEWDHETKFPSEIESALKDLDLLTNQFDFTAGERRREALRKVREAKAE